MNAAANPVRIRPSTLADYDGICGVVRRAGMTVASRASHQRRWMENPFRPSGDVTTGWLMETPAGEVVGWVGNVYSGYELDGRPLLAVATHALAVDIDYRNRSLGMLAAFFRQPGVDIYLSTTANASAGRVFTAFKADRVPHPSYDKVAYWPTDAAGFYAAAARLKRLPAPGLVGGLAALGLWPSSLRTRALWKDAPPTNRIDSFDSRFDDFWADIRTRPGRLIAVRTARALTWHFADGAEQKRLAIIGLAAAGSLAGYAILIRRDQPAIGLNRYVIADLQTRREDPQLVRGLVKGAIAAAKDDGVHVVEATGFDGFKRGVIASLAPRVRQSPNWPFYYKAATPELAAQLRHESVWDPCPYDGDAAF